MVNPSTTFQPLQDQFPIVDPKTGKPTQYFIRWAQQRMLEIDGTVPPSRRINTDAPLSGGGDLSVDLTLGLDDSAVAPATYGDATHVAQVTVDQKGIVQGVTDVAIALADAEDEGVLVVAAPSSLNFAGAGVTVTESPAGVALVTIPGSSGGGPVAWLRYNGATDTILSSFNVGSVTKNGTGDYTINFASALGSADYAVALTGTYGGGPTNIGINIDVPTHTVNALRIYSVNFGNALVDCTDINAIVFL